MKKLLKQLQQTVAGFINAFTPHSLLTFSFFFFILYSLFFVVVVVLLLHFCCTFSRIQASLPLLLKRRLLKRPLLKHLAHGKNRTSFDKTNCWICQMLAINTLSFFLSFALKTYFDNGDNLHKRTTVKLSTDSQLYGLCIRNGVPKHASV